MKIEEVDGVSVTASWEPPQKDGGANVSGYVVEQRDAHRPGWTTVSESVTRPCFKFTRLSEGTEYVFRVAAMNRFGVGGFLQSEVVECRSSESKFCLPVCFCGKTSSTSPAHWNVTYMLITEKSFVVIHLKSSQNIEKPPIIQTFPFSFHQ